MEWSRSCTLPADKMVVSLLLLLLSLTVSSHLYQNFGLKWRVTCSILFSTRIRQTDGSVRSLAATRGLGTSLSLCLSFSGLFLSLLAGIDAEQDATCTCFDPVLRGHWRCDCSKWFASLSHTHTLHARTPIHTFLRSAAVTQYLMGLRSMLDTTPLSSWAQYRYEDLMLAIHWMYDNEPQVQFTVIPGITLGTNTSSCAAATAASPARSNGCREWSSTGWTLPRR
jgi:hypothetical protein